MTNKKILFDCESLDYELRDLVVRSENRYQFVYRAFVSTTLYRF